jgi:hypothetical protein
MDNSSNDRPENFDEEFAKLLASVGEPDNVYSVLTNEIIDTATDDELLQIVVDNLIAKLPADNDNTYDEILQWKKPQQVIYLVWTLEAQVGNGGFNQFYYNPSGRFYKLLPEALEVVGAYKFAQLTAEANQTYEKEYGNITRHQDGTLEGFSKSYDDNPLDKYDDKFYDLYKTENLEQLQVKYIRANKPDFIA